jgi:hypothetical protein
MDQASNQYFGIPATKIEAIQQMVGSARQWQEPYKLNPAQGQ